MFQAYIHYDSILQELFLLLWLIIRYTLQQMTPCMVRGKGRTLPLPRASRFLWTLNMRSSRFSSSVRALQ